MRILLANKFYYRRGGDCIYTLNLESLLKEHGHEVAVFAMQHPENLPTPYAEYFPTEVKFRPGPGIVEAIRRPFGTAEVRRKFAKLLDDFKPDVVHLNNIHSQLSPVIAQIAKERGIRVVWTLHDYKLLCPRYDCKFGGRICLDCIENPRLALDRRCVKGSLLASYIGYREAKKWTRPLLESVTDTFICPSVYMADNMKKGLADKEKVAALCNFIDVEKCAKEDYSRDDYYCFVGRLSHEKGVATLVKAASTLPYRLVVVGDGPLHDELKASAPTNVEFVGFKNWPEIKEILGRARFMVIPSEWAENNPLSVIESLCLGTPVLGARIGGIPELITEAAKESSTQISPVASQGGTEGAPVTGLTFESGNSDALTSAIKSMWETTFDNAAIAASSLSRFNSENYYTRLLHLYSGQ